MTGRPDRGEERECLVAEALAELEALGDRERCGELGFLAFLFGVDLRPLGLVARREKRLVGARGHLHRWYLGPPLVEHGVHHPRGGHHARARGARTTAGSGGIR